MKLIDLKLKNFKGIKSFELQANGENLNIFGDNGTGKTTIFDAILWLIFGKDSQNKADFDIKTLDKNNQPIHGLEHEVEAVFDVNGRPLNLRKVFSENWTQKRGSASREFSGHTTKYFVNGVPVKESEYKSKISEIASETTFKLLTSPTYFNVNLSWQDRRKILLEVCGDVRDEDVIAANPDLKRLPEILQGRSTDDYRKIIASQRTKINDELQTIPVRISEVGNSLPDISNLIPEALPADIEKYKQMIKTKQEELSTIKNGGAASELTKQLRVIEGELLKIQNDFRASIDTQIQTKRNEIFVLEGKVMELTRATAQLDYSETIKQYENLLKKQQSDRENLLSEWRAINASTFQFEQSETCPTCGQPLPAEQLAEAREKALAAFNLQKAEKLEANKANGMAKAAEIKSTEEKIAELKGNEAKANSLIETKKTERAQVENQISGIRSDIDKLKSQDPKQTSEYQTKLQEKQRLESEIAAAENGKSADTEPLQNEINELTRDKEALEKAQHDVEQHRKGTDRIEELKQQEKQLSKEYERLESELFVIEEFIRSKVSLLEDKINNRFKFARFKLFETQLNGGLSETCETLYDGVPYSSGLNTGHRIIVGLDIISTLSEHYGFTAPIIIDNQESITKLPEMKAQVISLVVSAADKKLRVEYSGQIAA